MGGVAQRRAHRQAAQQHVADQHRKRRDNRGEGPAAIENREQHDAEDEGGEAVAGECDAVAARDGGDEDQQRAGEREVFAGRHPPVDVGDKPGAETDERGGGNGDTNDQRGPHVLWRKVGAVARCVKRDYRLRHDRHN